MPRMVRRELRAWSGAGERLKMRFYFFNSFFVFLTPHPRHMEVPRLGVEFELTPQPQQLQIRVAPATYTTAHGQAGSLTH